MRPIKYRAWDKTEKKMYDLRDMYFNVSIDHPRVVFEMPFEMVDEDWKDHDLVLLAFTGLTDRNGTEIYESDIISEDPAEWNGNLYYFIVNFKDGCWEAKSTIPYDPDARGCLLTNIKNPKIEGNVFENPGLLKGE